VWCASVPENPTGAVATTCLERKSTTARKSLFLRSAALAHANSMSCRLEWVVAHPVTESAIVNKPSVHLRGIDFPQGQLPASF